jgi:hypothetical protein
MLYRISIFNVILCKGKERNTIVECKYPVITKVLMNPPFALKRSGEKDNVQ